LSTSPGLVARVLERIVADGSPTRIPQEKRTGTSDDGAERRRDPRLSTSWLVEVWLHEDVFATGCVVDVSTRGLCVKTSDTAGNVMRTGELCRLKIHTDSGVLACTGEIRNIDQRGIQFEVREPSAPWWPAANTPGDHPTDA
jgi:PilZ domain